jgi:starch synthase
MKVLFLAAEAVPLAKVGGLADVAGELPRALRNLEADVRLALPRHPAAGLPPAETKNATSFRIEGGVRREQVEVEAIDLDGLPAWLVAGAPIQASPTVYGDLSQDVDKYTFFSLAALAACPKLHWMPDVIHANDWHAAPALVDLRRRRLAEGAWRRVAGVLTVHNLPFMGQGGEANLAAWGIGPGEGDPLPIWARALPLPLGLVAADQITTVSPGYASEILTPELGCGLEAFLTGRSHRLTGILNGLDLPRWDPATDPTLPAGYSIHDLGPRTANRRRLLEELGLADRPGVPLLAMVTRLDRQKGVDLALDALHDLRNHEWTFILLGSGDPALEDQARSRAATYPERVRLAFRHDEALARRIYAGADMVLVPSRYEPCGLTQLISMRYGAVPVARATGGLKDTVHDAQHGMGTGFLFEQASPRALAQALRRAFATFADKSAWQALQVRGMSVDSGWDRSAREYLRVYERALAAIPATRG